MPWKHPSHYNIICNASKVPYLIIKWSVMPSKKKKEKRKTLPHYQIIYNARKYPTYINRSIPLARPPTQLFIGQFCQWYTTLQPQRGLHPRDDVVWVYQDGVSVYHLKFTSSAATYKQNPIIKRLLQLPASGWRSWEAEPFSPDVCGV